MPIINVTAQPIELVLQNTTERIDIQVVDAAGTPVDATGLYFELRTLGGTVLYSENWITAPSRIVRTSTGKYYFPMGATTVPASGVNPETGRLGDFLCFWQIIGPVDTEQQSIIQVARVASAYAFSLLPTFRLQIDKAAKRVNEDPENPCYLGYTDSMLIDWLLGGLSTWNLYEPYPTFLTLEGFPIEYRQGLIEAALLVGVQSQELFAVDTDIPNYSAQGSAFVIQHQPALANYVTRMAQRLDKIIPIAKLKLVRSGSLHTEMSPNYRLQTIVNMSPGGALFRNLFVSGG